MTTDALETLEQAVARELAATEVPPRQWVRPSRDRDGREMADVVIVGGGLSGLTIGFGLRRKGVARVRIIDQAPEGLEGPWLTSARMRTLRSPKTLSGLDYGTPALTYRAWHEAVYGARHYRRLGLIERGDWMAYLRWFRKVLALDVENGTRLGAIGHDGTSLRLTLDTPEGTQEVACRELVLATGIGGSGGPAIPPMVRRALPEERWTHSDAPFDCTRLEGRDVVVLGAAASAFDFAVAALAAGAASVTLLVRAASVATTEILDWSNFPGFLDHFAELDDAWRFRFTERMLAFRVPPTQEMYDRAMADPRFRLRTGAAMAAIGLEGGRIVLTTEGGERLAFDHLLLGTGYEVDLARRPELAAFAGKVALWRDRFVPPAGYEASPLLDYPYLGPAFEFLERAAGSAPFLRHIHLFNNGAVPSLGPICNGVTGLKYGAPRIVKGLTRTLFEEDIDQHFHALDSFDTRHVQI